MCRFILPQCTFSEVTSKQLLKDLRYYAGDKNLLFEGCQKVLDVLHSQEGLHICIEEDDPILSLRGSTILFPKVGYRKIWLAIKKGRSLCNYCGVEKRAEVVKLFLLVPDESGMYFTFYKKGESCEIS